MMAKREGGPEIVFTLVRQGALLAMEVIVVAHFTSLPAVVELNHNDFRRHMETAFRRWIDTELLSELSQSYSMVMMVAKRRDECEVSTGPMSERPLPIRVDQHDDPKVIGQYRCVEKVDGRSKYMNEFNDLGVLMQYDNHKWRMFCAANACYLVRGATGKYELAKTLIVSREAHFKCATSVTSAVFHNPPLTPSLPPKHFSSRS